ncbi:MAG: hypothetical protein AAF702_46845 [Chloroflexota bacterium]
MSRMYWGKRRVKAIIIARQCSATPSDLMPLPLQKMKPDLPSVQAPSRHRSRRWGTGVA